MGVACVLRADTRLGSLDTSFLAVASTYPPLILQWERHCVEQCKQMGVACVLKDNAELASLSETSWLLAVHIPL